MNPRFLPGRNMAMKVPTHEYTSTVAFYRETLGLRELTPTDADGEQTPRFEFGDKVLWLDRVAGISQAEIWLEVVTTIWTLHRPFCNSAIAPVAMKSNPCLTASARSGYRARRISST